MCIYIYICIVRYKYIASAKMNPVLREAMLFLLSHVNNDEIVPRRVCIHLLKPCLNSCDSAYVLVTRYIALHSTCTG